MEYDPGALEERWRERWREEGRYEADPDDEDGTFVTVPYPYPSGGMHIGHARTYTVPDAWARYRRLQGDTVLFPIAWHVTGTPIVGAVERLKTGEADQIEVLRDTYGVPESELADLETPMGFARYFIENHYKAGMRQLGLSIDWRREFTTNDERYSKFIEWQYETLRDHDHLEMGLHPVNYCTNEEQPVTAHDLLEGEDAEFQEYTLIKFDLDGTVVPMATLRPETVYGVTNAYVHPEATYVTAAVDDETWLISEEAAEKFRLQGRDVTVHETLDGGEFVGESVTNPITDEDVLVLPARFVDPDNGTGVVMSVPAHSPDDWVALEEIKDSAEAFGTYGIDPDEIRSIEPRAILDIEGYGEHPAGDIVAEFDISSQDDPALEDATQELYNREFHAGVLREMYGPYAGMVVEEARDDLRVEYRERGAFDSMYEFSEEVICRCGGDVEVSIQETWFLRYNDPEWKEGAERAVDHIDAIPENTREQYRHTIGWLNEWPCIRNYGLGTRLPWDRDFVIEPLSDSTIYMAYYTFAHRIDDVPIGDLHRDFFDALFYGPDAVDDPDERALDLREEWDHWYPVDYRCSGNDLINNHLTFFLYHHADLFPPEKWPGGIAIMGMGLLEGEKMSSSKGHVVLPGTAIDEYGADTVRFFLLNSSEPWQDYDWRSEEVRSTRTQLERFWSRAHGVIDAAGSLHEDTERRRIDRWLLSKLQTTIEEATIAMDRFETRTASQAVFYNFEEHLRWYRRRTETDRPGAIATLRDVLEARVRLIAPFTPFLANELHERLTGIPAEDADWPTVDRDLERPRLEVEEELVRDLVADVREVVDVTGTDPDTVRIYVAADWKYRAFDEVAETGPDVGAVMGRLMQHDGLRDRGEAVNDLVGDLVEFVRDHPGDRVDLLRDVDEYDVYDAVVGYLEREFDADVECYLEGDAVDPAGKASTAVPFRPAIHIE